MWSSTVWMRELFRRMAAGWMVAKTGTERERMVRGFPLLAMASLWETRMPR